MLSSYSFYPHYFTHSSKPGAAIFLPCLGYSLQGVLLLLQRHLNLPFTLKAGFALLKPSTFRQHSAVVYLSVLFKTSQNKTGGLNNLFSPWLFSSSSSSTVFLPLTNIMSKILSCLGDLFMVGVQVFSCCS